MQNDNILKDIFSDKSIRNKLSIFYTFAVALMIYQGAVFFVIKGDEISSKGDVPVFDISFTESSENFEDSRVVGDESREIVTYTPSNTMHTENSGMGMLIINVTFYSMTICQK